MRFHKIVIIFSMLTVLPVASALACFHQPSCFTRCAQLPLWEVPFCDLGSIHTPVLQGGNLKNPIDLYSSFKTNHSDKGLFNVKELYRQ
ncbi:hypothetical protein AB8970_11515 [Yersinia enterocolitica]|uniref:hypothetical protein n=1 Tax=Yersinia enterocolitica TaxID=630 RepID=UPI00094BA485|nr:hypothetical protein [Yersinia enterocolitica]MBX9487823.1 hypothetical protein [Yersinia enterocolitica]MBX9493365.1 hypothetical protein [Yersinia enterocolitica]HDL8054979.1 hypothetical protein [Yersinia enterocolitica]HEN3641992.1 hypothetical protein [Yersinia enterocolitica]HEN3647216.1 hypothetical protein [Yersinia enterocolitica]